MDISEVTRENLPQAVAYAIRACEGELRVVAQTASHSRLQNDLSAALKALSLIASELQTGIGRPRGERAGGFTRYAIDAGPRLAIDEELRELVVRIEYIYKKW